jgi:hypothetical protein
MSSCAARTSFESDWRKTIMKLMRRLLLEGARRAANRVRGSLVGAVRRKSPRWLSIGGFLVVVLAVAHPARADAGWARAGDMVVARWSFPAVTLPDGHVFVASGDRAELFDPAGETFGAAGTLTVDRGFGLTATLLADGRALLIGGQAGDMSRASAELYDPVGATFTPTGTMSVGRSFHTATLLPDGRVLIAGGHQFNHPASAPCQRRAVRPLHRNLHRDWEHERRSAGSHCHGAAGRKGARCGRV